MSDEKKNDGGAAFPVQMGHAACIPSEGCRVHPGITVRDYFAAAALPGLLSGTAGSFILADAARSGQASGELVAETAYMFADAMLAQRNKAR